MIRSFDCKISHQYVLLYWSYYQHRLLYLPMIHLVHLILVNTYSTRLYTAYVVEKICTTTDKHLWYNLHVMAGYSLTPFREFGCTILVLSQDLDLQLLLYWMHISSRAFVVFLLGLWTWYPESFIVLSPFSSICYFHIWSKPTHTCMYVKHNMWINMVD